MQIALLLVHTSKTASVEVPQPGMRISPSKDTVTPVSGHLTPAELIPLPQIEEDIPGEALSSLDRSVHPVYTMHPAEGNLKSPLQNQLHDHTSSKPVHRGADTAETRRPEHAWTHKGG